MDAWRWERINETFQAAIALTKDERSAFLAEACAGDEELRLQLQRLVQAHQRSSGFLERPAVTGALRILASQDGFSAIEPSLTSCRAAAKFRGTETLGYYRLVGPIGHGGMGQVFRAQDTRLRRDVAIKILHDDATGDDRARRRLLREARAAAALSHPSIVTVYSVDEVADCCFIVMELVDGVTLADRLATGALELSEVCEIGAQVADALAAAHAIGIVHHDVTPRNILFTASGRAKLADFGLSRAVGPQHISLESTPTGREMAGTLYYMSPEQVRGEMCTPRADLFSFGSVLYQAATGRRPFEGGTHLAVVDAILRVDPPRPSAVRSGLPSAFDTLVGGLLEKRIEDRTIDALHVARVLRSLSASLNMSGGAIADAVHPRSDERTPFVGRARELTQLSAVLARASAGAGGTVVISGDAGMGKTALVDAFLHARDTLAVNPLVCRGQSVEYSGAGDAYLPVIDALAPIVAQSGHPLHEIVRTNAPSWRSQFPGVYPSQETALTPPTPARLARELGDALSAAARSRPVVMIVEDVHWADPSTTELLRHLAHRARRVALLIIVTCRPEEAAAAGSSTHQLLAEVDARGLCDTIELTRLDDATVSEYLERRFGLSEFSTPLTSLLSKATEGHPLFLTSLVQLFVQRGDLQRVGEEWRLVTPTDRLQLAIPRTVQAVIRRKLAALDEADRRLLQQASIEGQEFSTAVLSALAGSDPGRLEERLETMAKGSRMVTSIGPERHADGTWGARYQFAHAVYHSVVYSDLSPSRRADLHRQVAERLATLYAGRTASIAAQLARHFKDGRDENRAFEHYLQAGDNSMRLSAGREAEGHYSQAIALLNLEGTAIEPNRIARAYSKRAVTRVLLGNPLGALSDGEAALGHASQASDPDLTFEIRVLLAYTHIWAEGIDKAMQAAAELERSVEPPPGGRKRLSYSILDQQLKMGRGDLDQAALTGDSAVALARSLGDAERLLTSLSVRAQLHYYRVEYTSALPLLRELCVLGADTRRLGDPRPVYAYLAGTLYLGLTLGDLGYVSEALTTLQSGLGIARTEGYSYWVPQLLGAIGGLLSEVGALDAALQHAEDAVAEAAGQDTEIRVEARLNLASACLRVGRMDRAADLLPEADTLTRQKFGFAWLCRVKYTATAAEDALARGEILRATELAQESNALARRYGVWKYVIVAERLLAETSATQGAWSQAGAHAQEAVDILTARPVPILAWRVHATAARIHRRRGLDAQSAAALEQARDEARQLSDRIQEQPLRATFLESFRRFVEDSEHEGINH